MNIDGMRMYCEIFESGSVVAASEHLFLSPQAVSKRLKRIESELEADLFVRSSKGLRPTQAGIQTYRAFNSMLQTYDKLCDDVCSPRRNCPSINIGIDYYNANMVNLDFIEHFFEHSKFGTRVHVEYLSNGECYRLVRNGKMDIAVTNEPLTARGQFIFRLLKYRPALVALSERDVLASLHRDLSFDDFADRTFLGIRDADSTNRAIRNIFEKEGIRLRERDLSFESGALVECVKSGAGFHVFPESLLRRYRDVEGITVRCFPSDEPIFQIGLVTAPNAADKPAVTEFLEKASHGNSILTDFA